MFILQEEMIDAVRLRQSSCEPTNGALVSFEGIVRADKCQDGTVAALLYIADAPACLSEGEKILQEAVNLFPVTKAVCVQRIGQVKVGETAAWIGVWAGHRDEAFQACRYIIEEIKKRLLVWKKEFYADGTSKWVRGNQVLADL